MLLKVLRYPINHYLMMDNGDKVGSFVGLLFPEEGMLLHTAPAYLPHPRPTRMRSLIDCHVLPSSPKASVLLHSPGESSARQMRHDTPMPPKAPCLRKQ